MSNQDIAGSCRVARLTMLTSAHGQDNPHRPQAALAQRSHDELIGDISDLFTRLDAVKDYYALRLSGPSEDLVAGYKATIRNEFFPARVRSSAAGSRT